MAGAAAGIAISAPTTAISGDEYDAPTFTRQEAKSRAELLETFEKGLASALSERSF